MFQQPHIKHQNIAINYPCWNTVSYLFETESIYMHLAVQFNSFPYQLQQLLWRMPRPPQKRKNARISTKRREQLINDVVKKGKAVFRAANRLRIQPSTARLIVMRYLQTGTFYQRKMIEDIRREQQNRGEKGGEVEEINQQVKVQVKEEIKSMEEQQYYPFLQFFSPIHLDAHLPLDLGSTSSDSP